jgi:hypothetical protein
MPKAQKGGPHCGGRRSKGMAAGDRIGRDGHAESARRAPTHPIPSDSLHMLPRVHVPGPWVPLDRSATRGSGY